MQTVLATTALAGALLVIGACLVLQRQARALQRRAADLEAKVSGLLPAPPLAPDLTALLGTGKRRVLVVEILNPVELAVSKVSAARLLGAMRPALLTKVVYDQASKQVVEQLEREGILADVRVHAAR